MFPCLQPDKMDEKRTCNGGTYISGDSGIISQKKGNVPEYLLRHTETGTDIKHINGPVRVKGQIQNSRNQAAGQIKESRACKILKSGICHMCISGVDSKKY